MGYAKMGFRELFRCVCRGIHACGYVNVQNQMHWLMLMCIYIYILTSMCILVNDMWMIVNVNKHVLNTNRFVDMLVEPHIYLKCIPYSNHPLGLVNTSETLVKSSPVCFIISPTRGENRLLTPFPQWSKWHSRLSQKLPRCWLVEGSFHVNHGYGRCHLWWKLWGSSTQSAIHELGWGVAFKTFNAAE